jgi:hypothetical protein
LKAESGGLSEKLIEAHKSAVAQKTARYRGDAVDDADNDDDNVNNDGGGGGGGVMRSLDASLASVVNAEGDGDGDANFDDNGDGDVDGGIVSGVIDVDTQLDDALLNGNGNSDSGSGRGGGGGGGDGGDGAVHRLPTVADLLWLQRANARLEKRVTAADAAAKDARDDAADAVAVSEAQRRGDEAYAALTRRALADARDARIQLAAAEAARDALQADVDFALIAKAKATQAVDMRNLLLRIDAATVGIGGSDATVATADARTATTTTTTTTSSSSLSKKERKAAAKTAADASHQTRARFSAAVRGAVDDAAVRAADVDAREQLGALLLGIDRAAFTARAEPRTADENGNCDNDDGEGDGDGDVKGGSDGDSALSVDFSLADLLLLKQLLTTARGDNNTLVEELASTQRRLQRVEAVGAAAAERAAVGAVLRGVGAGDGDGAAFALAGRALARADDNENINDVNNKNNNNDGGGGGGSDPLYALAVRSADDAAALRARVAAADAANAELTLQLAEVTLRLATARAATTTTSTSTAAAKGGAFENGVDSDGDDSDDNDDADDADDADDDDDDITKALVNSQLAALLVGIDRSKLGQVQGQSRVFSCLYLSIIACIALLCIPLSLLSTPGRFNHTRICQ